MVWSRALGSSREMPRVGLMEFAKHEGVMPINEIIPLPSDEEDGCYVIVMGAGERGPYGFVEHVKQKN